MFGSASPGKRPSGALLVRLQLLQEEGVQDLLDSSKMRVNGLLDPPALAQFLSRAHRPDFPFNAQWNRLLSLEQTLRVLEHTRQDSSSAR